MKQAVILAGGKGTRLYERLSGLPKPMIDIAGKPLLGRQIDLLRRYGYTKIFILVNYAADVITNFCKGNSNWGIDIECIDDGEPRGTGGAVLAILPRLAEHFLVVYGDTMLQVDLDRLLDFHRLDSTTDITLLVHPNDHPYDSDLVECDEAGWITGFHPYPHPNGYYFQNLVNAALYMIRRDVLLSFVSPGGMVDFGKDIFPSLLRSGARMKAYKSSEYIKDCGTPERWEKVVADYKLGRISRSSLDVPQKAIFLDRDGVINREVGHLHDPDKFELLPGVSKAIRKFNDTEFRLIVATNQPVLARGECSAERLREIHNKMETLLGHDCAYLDRIYYCPHHPDKGFPYEVPELKINCTCRKPEIGIIEKAAIELNIDISQSWFIGDSTTDILTASRAGLASILVETGHAGMDRRHPVCADYIVPDLNAAAELIIRDLPRIHSECASIFEAISAGDVVFIGGLSRSGKSNLASVLRKWLKERKSINAHRISIDGWLKPPRMRGEGVLERYDHAELIRVISNICNQNSTMKINIPLYDKVIKAASLSQEIEVNCDDVVIIEGTIALLLSERILSKRPVHNWFAKISEEKRKERVVGEYRLRGMSRDEADKIYKLREQDESPIVKKSADNATSLITF